METAFTTQFNAEPKKTAVSELFRLKFDFIYIKKAYIIGLHNAYLHNLEHLFANAGLEKLLLHYVKDV